MKQDLWQLDHVQLGPASRPRLSVEALSIPAGVTAVLGESGAGKTSLLNLLVGFEQPDEGAVDFGRRPEDTRLPPRGIREIAWVPADGGLWPQLTVREHLEGVLPSVATPLSGPATLADDWLARFDLTSVGDQRPDSLSLGERSRLSVARALASGATIHVMDEPLAHVDLARQSKYWSVIRSTISQRQGSLVFATHAPEPVLREASHVICLSQGRLAWQGAVSDLYRRPPNHQVATFLGPMNWFVPEEAEHWLGRTLTEPVCIRPEQLEVIEQQAGPFRVDETHFAGSIAEAVVRDVATDRCRTLYHRPHGDGPSPGTTVALRILLFCLLFMLGFSVSGCGSEAAGRPLSVTKSRHYSLPAEGAMLPAPRGMTFGPNEELFVLDNAGRMLVYNKSGELVRQWRMPDYKIGKPEGSCVMLDGRIAVADTHYHRVVFFDQQGTVVGMLGEEGNAPAQFIYPVGVTQDAHGHLYVAEYGGNDRVQKFTADGKFVLAIGKSGTQPGEFQRPSGVVWREGVVYVADAINNRIQAFQDDGQFLRVVADAETACLYYPYDVALAPDDTLFVVEYGGGRVSQISLDGKLLGQYGSPGRGEGQLYTPWGIAVSKSGKVAIADTGNRRVVELQL